MLKDRNVVAQLVRRAERAGFKAIALTVDTPILGHREADIKNRLATHLEISIGTAFQQNFIWFIMVELINLLL